MKIKIMPWFGAFLSFIVIIGCFMQNDVTAQKVQPSNLRESLKLIDTIDLKNDELFSRVFTGNNELFITARNRITNGWSFRKGKVQQAFAPCNNKDYLIAVPNGNGNLASIGCRDFSVEVWNLNTAKMLLRFQVQKDKDSEYLIPYISPDGKRILIKFSGLKEQAELWNAIDGTKIATFTSSSTKCTFCNRTVYAVEFSPDSKIVSVSFGGIVSLWDTENGKLLNRLIDENVHLYSSEALSHNGIVSQILFSNDSRAVVTGAYDGTSKSWNVETGKLLNTFKGHKERITSLALSPDGKTLATGSRDQDFKLWDFVTSKLLLTSADNKKAIHILSFSPDNKKILSMTDNQVFIWETASGRLLEQMSSPGELKTRFSPNWQLVIMPDKQEKTLGLYEYTGK